MRLDSVAKKIVSVVVDFQVHQTTGLDFEDYQVQRKKSLVVVVKKVSIVRGFLGR